MNECLSRLYQCTVIHLRKRPKIHTFTYRVFMFSIDLDDLSHLSDRLKLFSHNRWNLFTIHDNDHINLGKPGGIRSNLLEWLKSIDFKTPENMKIRLVTFPRVFGYSFNPVSFYYLSRETGEPIGVVAEVVNTFREMKLYLIDRVNSEGVWCSKLPKNFYVSPFSNPGSMFDFKIGPLKDHWKVEINTYENDQQTLHSSISGNERDLSNFRLIYYAIKFPLLSFKIIGLIHWQAFLLWIKGLPYYRKSSMPDLQQDVLRPHKSINHSDS
ncbi:DUF1365 domain-containing protein [Luteolibacter pohnpeiensis]|uniref:DUF1365 domain-containing protein n=1 Tax=Luteolibacter pohnpeiensis TaxID=454153 RepID=A0A934SAN3_9BACT|nr:DUF1365 domain-containing protein [Luteolibacter pohnpeiensis]MBK1882414.1 DUF1365 domain-containing protein [Luteolibacter pohnpeiensis]